VYSLHFTNNNRGRVVSILFWDTEQRGETSKTEVIDARKIADPGLGRPTSRDVSSVGFPWWAPKENIAIDGTGPKVSFKTRGSDRKKTGDSPGQRQTGKLSPQVESFLGLGDGSLAAFIQGSVADPVLYGFETAAPSWDKPLLRKKTAASFWVEGPGKESLT